MPYSPPILDFKIKNARKINEDNKERHKEYNDKRSEVESLYKTYKWEKIRKQILRRDSYLCVLCRKENIIKVAWGVDHIIPAKENPDLFFDVSNLRSVCRSHNVRLSKKKNTTG